MKNNRILMILVLATLITLLTAGTALAKKKEVPSDPQRCADVVTFAKEKKGGKKSECIMFPDPCSVPEGWEICGPYPVDDLEPIDPIIMQ